MEALLRERGIPMRNSFLLCSSECSTSTIIDSSTPLCLGIDEAGRGPVLGPMVYAAACTLVENQSALKDLGMQDSKQLDADQRKDLLNSILSNDRIWWMASVLSPRHISACMLQKQKYNLNALSHDTAIELIRQALKQNLNVTQVFVDTVGDPGKYQDRLTQLFPGIDCRVSKKADSLFPIVSTASIVAKNIRDWLLEEWQFLEGNLSLQFGSGYTSDPNTVKWLNESVDPVFGFSQLVRFSWSTCSRKLETDACQVTWLDDEEENDQNSGNKQITGYFKKRTLECETETTNPATQTTKLDPFYMKFMAENVLF